MLANDDEDDDNGEQDGDDGEQDDDEGEQDDDGGSHLNRVCVPVLRLLLRLQVWRQLASLKQNCHLFHHHRHHH